MATETQHPPRRWRRLLLESAGWIGAVGISISGALGMHALAAQPFHTTLDDPLALPRELTSRAQIPGVPLPPLGQASLVAGGPAVTVTPSDGATAFPSTQLASAKSPASASGPETEAPASTPVSTTAPAKPASTPPAVSRPPATTTPPTTLPPAGPPPTNPPPASPPATIPPPTTEPAPVIVDSETIQRLIDEARGRGNGGNTPNEASNRRFQAA